MGYLVGKYMRDTNIKKAILGGKTKLTINKESTFNIVTYKEVKQILSELLRINKKGIFNIAQKKLIKIREITEYYNTEAEFGNFLYKSPKISNKKISDLHLPFNCTKQEIISKLKSNI